MELLVVVGIITVLISILTPSLVKARQSANQVRCLSNVRQIATAAFMYANDYQGSMPACRLASNQWSSGYSNLIKAQNFNYESPPGSAGNKRTPTGIGWLIYLGYMKNVQAAFCPSRTDNTPYSYSAERVLSNFNNSRDEAAWNPGLYSPSNGLCNAGYLFAVADSIDPVTHNAPSTGNGRQCDYSRAHRIGRAHPETPMVIDTFWMVLTGSGWRMDGQTALNHGKGICFASFDGSARFFYDPKDILGRSFVQSAPTPGPAATGWSGYALPANHDRWAWNKNAVVVGSWPSGIAYLKRFALGWGDAQIQKSTPDY